ncbi:peptidoglycan DD-metalloendopeptidase family protein [Yeosuana marina]|uniref:peptidoglycan DD-metalloendopeptidase family protein n=1 Tax=Yeosuana marina TaxID=1565536 RepID=UPI00141EEEAA|nr:peptidoglycan DD-metalloendopeptidase family protein [Yeosuana marina]
MKEIIFILSAFLFINNAFAQNESEVTKTVANNFQQKYNANDYQGIYEMFSNEMKNFMPLEKTLAFLRGLNSEAGAIKTKSFVKYEQPNVALYKTNFERIVVALYISVDENSNINGLMVKPFKEENLPELNRNVSKLKLPFNEEWTVLWGGDTKELNYHVIDNAQKNAFDFVITNQQGKSYENEGKTNEDFYAFGKQLISPTDGEVVLVVDGIKDNKPGIPNPLYVPGNTVIIKTENNEYLFFAHFKLHSIVVKQGQMVKQGDVLGLCGNSGNSTEPHLHFHIQNVEDMNKATGAKSYFENILVNGELKNEYSPVKTEKVKNK